MDFCRAEIGVSSGMCGRRAGSQHGPGGKQLQNGRGICVGSCRMFSVRTSANDSV